MFSKTKPMKKIIFSMLGSFFFLTSHSFGIELNMYYPVAVGGPLTKIVD